MKTEAIERIPQPENIKQIQAFLGITGCYRRFIQDYVKVAKLLTILTKKNEKWRWTSDQQTAFETLKKSLLQAPILAFPDWEKSFRVVADASQYAIGAVLEQEVNGNMRPVAYASRTTNNAENNYSTGHREALAALYACEQFRPYIYSSPFDLINNHKVLSWLMLGQHQSQRLIR